MFIANTKPYQPVQLSTLAKWLLLAMTMAGIDTTLIKAHSTCSASATQMKQSGMSPTQILARAHWSETSGTFAKFYRVSRLTGPPLNSLSTKSLFILWHLKEISEQLTWDLVFKKSRIRETLNLSTDADHRTNIFTMTWS